MADDGGTFGIDKINRVLELPDGQVAPVAPSSRGAMRFNAARAAWEASVNGKPWAPFTGAGGGISQLVFDPLGAGPSGANVFSDWGELYTAFQQVPGFVTIVFTYDVTIPAGSYDLEGRATLFAPQQVTPGSVVMVTLAAGGVTLTGLTFVQGSIGLLQAGAGPSITLGDDEIFVLFEGARIGSTAGAGPLVLITGSGGNSQVNAAFGGVVVNAGAPAIEIADGAIGIFVGLLISWLDNDTVLGSATATFVFITDSVTQNPSPTLSGFAGTFITQYFSNGNITAYSATTGADWSGTPPTTVGEALDRIAAALGPIP